MIGDRLIFFAQPLQRSNLCASHRQRRWLTYLSYFTDSEERPKQMLPLAGEGLVWVEGLIPMIDPDGQEQLIATYTRQDGLQFPDECGPSVVPTSPPDLSST